MVKVALRCLDTFLAAEEDEPITQVLLLAINWGSQSVPFDIVILISRCINRVLWVSSLRLMTD